MRLFNFFRNKEAKLDQADMQNDTKPVDKNLYFVETLSLKLVEMGYEVKRHPQYLALIINSEIEIATMIIENTDYHPNLLHVLVLTSHSKYFPNGVKENIIGIGLTIKEQVISAANNYVNSIFLTIIDGFSDSHNLKYDFMTPINVNGGNVLWHPKLGGILTQGQWLEAPQNDYFFELLKEKIASKLTQNKMNWLKIYALKTANGAITAECIFNNDHWEDGLNEVTKNIELWQINGEFQGLKQFILFRRCDKYDEINY